MKLPHLAGTALGGRRTFVAGSDGSARPPPGGWAETIAPAVMTPSTRAVATAFNLVSIMVLHVLSHKDIVPTSRGDQESALGVVLSFDVDEVVFHVRELAEDLVEVD